MHKYSNDRERLSYQGLGAAGDTDNWERILRERLNGWMRDPESWSDE